MSTKDNDNTMEKPSNAGCGAASCSPIGFSPVAPVYDGGYYMRCMENDYEPEWVAVYWKDGVLRANLDSIGDYPIGMIHQGLTDVTWRHAISSSEIEGRL